MHSRVVLEDPEYQAMFEGNRSGGDSALSISFQTGCDINFKPEPYEVLNSILLFIICHIEIILLQCSIHTAFYFFYPLNPKSDQHLVSPYNSAAESFI